MSNTNTPHQNWNKAKINHPLYFIQSNSLVNFNKHRTTLYRKKPAKLHPLQADAKDTAEYIFKNKCVKTFWSSEIEWHDS